MVDDNKPCFITVSEVLRRSTNSTVDLLRMELEIEKGELSEQLHFASLEKIFIEERIYKDKQFEQAKSTDAALDHIDSRLEPYKPNFIREVTREDLQRLLEIKMARILKFNTDKADENIVALKKRIKELEHKLAHIIDHAIEWFEHLKAKYADLYPRQTELRNFETIQVTKVVEANEKLYINAEEGFVGIGLKKDENTEFVTNCSDMDDIIIFYKDGKYKVIKVADKVYVGKNILHVGVWAKNDKRTIYNAVYRNGKDKGYYIKRFAVSAVTRDKEYDLTQGTSGSKVVYFSANPNGEAEIIKVQLKPTTRRIKNLTFEKDFSEIAIKGRDAMGNILTKFDVAKIVLKQKGASTLGGTDIYFDRDVLRLNVDKRGEYLGNFDGDEQILVVTKSGDFYTTSFDLNNHYDDDLMLIEKFDAAKVWTAVLYDDEQKYHYIKRFTFEVVKNRTSYLVVGGNSRVDLLTDTVYPRIKVTFGGGDSFREAIEVDAEEFIGLKSYKAKGKRLSNYEVGGVEELEPLRQPEEPTDGGLEPTDGANANSEDVLAGIEIVTVQPDDPEQITEDGQMSLF